MKRIFYLLLICLSVLCKSCGLHNQNGYPSKVTFSQNGGEKKVYGEVDFYHIEISDYHYKDVSYAGYYPGLMDESDSVTVKLNWLTIKQPVGTSELIITAEPNTSKKKRKLYFHGDIVGNEYAEITVIQNK